VVVLGRIREIREGQVRGGRDDPARAEYLLYVVDVTEQRKGTTPGGVAYVQTMKPGLEPAAHYDAAAPKGVDVVLYLDASPSPERGTIPPPASPPVGVPVWDFTTPQGFLLLVDGEVVAPLAGSNRPVFPGGDPDRADLRSWLPN